MRLEVHPAGCPPLAVPLMFSLDFQVSVNGLKAAVYGQTATGTDRGVFMEMHGLVSDVNVLYVLSVTGWLRDFALQGVKGSGRHIQFCQQL